MGLFGDMARSAASAALRKALDRVEPDAASIENAQCARACQIVFAGNCERTIYTYYGNPLRGLRVGETFYADVVTRPTILRSGLTDGVWDTGREGVALAYRGKIFGATSVLGDTFKELARNNYAITVACKITGWYAEGYPATVLMIDDPEEILFWRDACKGLGREVRYEDRHNEESEAAASAERDRHRLSSRCGRELPFGVDGATLFFNDNEWTGTKPLSGREAIDLSTASIPPRPGSSAKPHIALSVDGMQVAEISARSSRYKTLSSHVGERPYLSVCEKRTGYDGSVLWMVTIVYPNSKKE